ncbi:MAG TPA: F0F1 ATP synthase subunit B [Caulobacteraceae bacterium]|nr:F0F1 ATP synthase subunit B [Caulobacteraceae bacterium]
MPAFFDPHFWSPGNAEFWVGAGLLIFLAIVVVARVPKAIAAGLDAKAAKIQSDLDEAARLRAEAQKMLDELKAQRAAAEAQARDMLAAAEADAKRLSEEAEAKLQETITRRQQLAERKIALAESQATADVKAAAADLAVQAAEAVLKSRLKGKRSDPLVEGAIGQLGSRFG